MILIEMKISVITTVLNGGKTLEKSIESVIKQNYKNIEYIIIDGNSSDNSLEIIKKYEKFITYWISEPDNGIYDAMNKGISLSTGDYICFLGADDQLYDKSVLDDVVEFIRNTNAKVICGKIMYVIDAYRVMKVVGGYLKDDDIRKGCMYPHPGTFVDSSILKEYRFNIGFKIASDYEFFLRLVCDGVKITFFDRIITYFHTNGISSNNKKLAFEEKYHAILLWCGKKYADSFKKTYIKYCVKIYFRKILLYIGVGRILGYRKQQ